jgi:hypothetical protein
VIGIARALIGILLAASAAPCESPAPIPEEPSVESIMARVARNQDEAQKLRQAYVYSQSLLLRFRQSNGKVVREETREYAVMPTDTGTTKELTRFAGSYEKDGRMIPYSQPGFIYRDTDIDGELINSLADDLANDRNSRDGIAADLFPLTAEEQRKYRFKLEETEERRGQLVHWITFKPANKQWDEADGTPWAGEILVDAAECQPVLVTTRLAQGIPIPVRTLLGTNLKGLGFRLSYQKFEDGIWFPVDYGAEFEVKVLFVYKRRIAIALANSSFKRALVATNVTFEPPSKVEHTPEERETRPAPTDPDPSPNE